MVRRLTFLAALVVASVFLSGGSYDRGGYATVGGYLGGMAGNWRTVKVVISPDTDYLHSDSLSAHGGPYDQVVNLATNPDEFLRGYVQMNDADRTSWSTTVDKIVIQPGTYWNDWDIAMSMQYFPLDDLVGFTDDDTEVISAELIEYWRWANSPYLTTSDTLYAIGGNRSDMLWWQSGTENSSKNYMLVDSTTPWPIRNSSTNPMNWGPVGHTAVSTIPLKQHDYVNDITMTENASVSFDCLAWAQGQADGDPNGGFWFMGAQGSGQASHAFNPLESTDSASHRPRLIIEYRYKFQPSSIWDLGLPVYASWDQIPNTSDPLPSAYYDSLAAVDVSIMHIQPLELDTYTGLVDSVRVRNPDWIPLFYVYAYGARRDYEFSTAGSLYNDIWLAIEDNDYWMRDTLGNKVSHGTTYTDYDMFDYGNPGMADTLASVYIKHLKERDNLRSHVGFFVDWFELPLRPWAMDIDAIDLNRNGTAYSSDAAAENLLIDRYIKEFAPAMRAEAGREDFLVVANGTVYQVEHENWGMYNYLFDGGMYEGFQKYFPLSFAQFDSMMTIHTYLFDNSRVNPPIVTFQSAHDSIGFSSEAMSIIAGGVAVFGNRDRSLAGIGVYLDEIVANDDRKLNLGTRVPGALWVTENDSMALAKFWNGVDTTYVRIQGYQDNTDDGGSPVWEFGLPISYEIIEGSTTKSEGSKAFR